MNDGQEEDEKVALVAHTDNATFFINRFEMEHLWRHMHEYASLRSNSEQGQVEGLLAAKKQQGARHGHHYPAAGGHTQGGQ